MESGITVIHVLGVLFAILSALAGYLFKAQIDNSARITTLEAIIENRKQERESQEKMTDERLSHIAQLIEVENKYLKSEIEKLSRCLIRLHERMDTFMGRREEGRVSGAYLTNDKGMMP